MPGNSQVADLIMQLMRRSQSGGLPMQASPELVQYLAHAQAGSAPPQIRGNPMAPVVPGPGSVPEVDPAIRSEMASPDFLAEPAPQQSFRDLEITPTSLVSDDLPASHTFIWYTHPKTGKRIKLDGPFANDIEAARALKELRAAGIGDVELDISPDFDS